METRRIDPDWSNSSDLITNSLSRHVSKLKLPRARRGRSRKSYRVYVAQIAFTTANDGGEIRESGNYDCK